MQTIHTEKVQSHCPTPPVQLEAVDLKHAYRQDQLELVFQPTLELGSGQVWSVEALMRWRHPERGLLLPHQFLELAPPKLALELNRWVLLEASQKLSALEKQLADPGEHRLTVNVFVGDFLPTFLEELPQLERMGGWPLERLELDCSVESSVGWPEQLSRLSGWGAWGSLEGPQQLKEFQKQSLSTRPPVKVWQINSSILHQLAGDPARWKQLERQVLHARSLGLVVLAKGIESLRQAFRLRKIGCQVGQGFCFSRPTRLSSLAPWLEAGASMYPPRGSHAPQ